MSVFLLAVAWIGTLIGAFVFGFVSSTQTIRVLHYLHNLSAGSFMVPQRSKEIADALKMDQPNVTAALRSLERSGYVERSPDANISQEDLAVRGGRPRSVWQVRRS